MRKLTLRGHSLAFLLACSFCLCLGPRNDLLATCLLPCLPLDALLPAVYHGLIPLQYKQGELSSSSSLCHGAVSQQQKHQFRVIQQIQLSQEQTSTAISTWFFLPCHPVGFPGSEEEECVKGHAEGNSWNADHWLAQQDGYSLEERQCLRTRSPGGSCCCNVLFCLLSS